MSDAPEEGRANETGESDAPDGSDATGAPDATVAPDAPQDESLRRRVVEQFSGAGEHAAIWRGFERFLPTGAYLNLGYSPRYLPTLVGDSQARLAARLADGLAVRCDDPAGARLLDIGCGRGGPARQFAARDFTVTGIDLVPYNVSRARANVRVAGRNAGAALADTGGPGVNADAAQTNAVGALANTGTSDNSAVECANEGRFPQFLVGDATALPFGDDEFAACAAVDSLVYIPDEAAAFAEAARVLADGGWFVTADLLADDDAPPGTGGPLAEFAAAWDLAPIASVDVYLDRLRGAEFTVETVEDITPNSVGRFRKWSGLFLALADGPTGGPLRGLLREWGVDPDAATAQVRAAHRALSHLRHVIVYARL